MSISIILPTYNEKGNIIKLVREIIRAVKKSLRDFKIYVVDDNSPDKTGEICKEYFKDVKNVRVFIRKNERGFASAILYGIRKSREDVVIVMDTDFSHDPRLIPEMIAKLRNHDIVIASRYVRNGGGEDKTRFFLSNAYNIYLRVILRIRITDFLFGYFCVRRRFLVENSLITKEIFYGFGDYFMRLAYHIHKSGGSFFEIPAFYKNRTYGTTKSNLIKMILTYTKTSFNLLKNDFFYVRFAKHIRNTDLVKSQK